MHIYSKYPCVKCIKKDLNILNNEELLTSIAFATMVSFAQAMKTQMNIVD